MEKFEEFNPFEKKVLDRLGKKHNNIKCIDGVWHIIKASQMFIVPKSGFTLDNIDNEINRFKDKIKVESYKPAFYTDMLKQVLDQLLDIKKDLLELNNISI